MNIPSRVNPFGYDNSIPPGYVRADFLESTGTQYIDTDFHSENMRSISVRVQKTENRCRLMMTIASFVPKPLATACGIGDGNVYDKTTYGCSWEDGLRAYNVGHTNPVVLKKDATYGYMTVDGVSVWTTNYGWYNLTNDKFLEAHPLRLFANVPQNNRNYNSSFVRMWWAKAESAEGSTEFIPVIDSAGRPCMYDTVTRKVFYNKGTGQFIAGLSMKQARNLAKLPATGGSLTISLPQEARLVQHNQRVESALATATEKGWNISVQYRDEFEDSSIENKYAECVNYSDMYNVNPEFTEVTSTYGVVYHTLDLTSDGDFPYNLPKLNGSKQHWVNGGLFRNVFVDKFFIKLPALVDATSTCCFCKSKEIYFDAPKAKYMLYVFSDCLKLEKATFTSSPTDIERICFSYKPLVFREIYGDFTKVTNAKQAFYNCQLNKETVLRICSELPTVSSKIITIGIHVDHQTDEEITEALANLETKGWDLTVQWRGTPTAQTASTFGLRKPPIYAKIDTMEHPDGTVEDYLDWGHYVTDWEENGYQEFASIEEAEEHFNIKKEIEE